MACHINQLSVHPLRHLWSCGFSCQFLPLKCMGVLPKRRVGGLRGVHPVQCKSTSNGSFVVFAAANDNSGLNVEQLLTLQTNIDDCSPQIVSSWKHYASALSLAPESSIQFLRPSPSLCAWFPVPSSSATHLNASLCLHVWESP